jgi:uncharacterized protein (TIGR02145 family)
MHKGLKMRIVFFIIILIPIVCFDQCISGNCENGYGTYKYSNGNTYTGNWMNGVRHGLGSLTFANGDCLSGEWVNNKMTGKGTYLWLGGYYYTGEWQNGQMTGLGYMIYSNGAKREGNFVNGEFITPIHAISTIYSKPPYNDPNYFLNLCAVTNSSSLINFGSQNTLKTVTLGNQVWCSENLKLDKFKNGEIIKQAKTLEEWNGFIQRKEPAWCYYEFFDFNDEFYGKLYNWYAVNDPRGLAPSGFHVSTSQDWKTLLFFLEKEEWFIEKSPQYRIQIPAYALKSKQYWVSEAGIDKYGFRAVPGGYLNGLFHMSKSTGNWWCSDKPKETTLSETHYGFETPGETYATIIYCSMYSNNQQISFQNISYRPYSKENNADKIIQGFSVRCVKD